MALRFIGFKTSKPQNFEKWFRPISSYGDIVQYFFKN